MQQWLSFLLAVVLSTSLAGAQEGGKRQEGKRPDRQPRPAPPEATGRVEGENRATPVERIKAAPGFKVELLYAVPSDKQGSWINLCVDGKGRIIASDQYGG